MEGDGWKPTEAAKAFGDYFLCLKKIVNHVLTYNIIWRIVCATSNIIRHIILHEQEER